MRAPCTQGQALYLLSDGQHHVLAGNLDSWPQISGRPGNIVEFDYERPVNGKLEARRARGRALPACRAISCCWSPRMCMTAT